jgi:hypothetical protein
MGEEKVMNNRSCATVLAEFCQMAKKRFEVEKF